MVVEFHSENDLKLKKASSMITKDYTDITGLDDLKSRSALIQGLCYPGMEDSCQCEDPMIGKGREGQRHWLKTVHENKDAVSTIKDGADVIFYGDSITEGWKGTSYGFPNGRKEDNYAVFKSLFTSEGGGKFDGIPMGISGDRSPDLLWRITQGGELPKSLNVPVIWLLIGTNDMGWAWCSPEVTLVGILRVVEELLVQKPGSTIVVNGLLPRSFDQKRGYLMRSTTKGGILSKLGRTIGLGKKKDPPLWEDIQAINAQLEEYSGKRDNVEYFDSSDIFIKDMLVKEKDLRIDVNLMNDYLHPSALGYKLWGDQIVRKLEKLLST